MLSFMVSNLSEKREPAFFARSPEKIKHAGQPPCIEKKYQETPTQEYANSQNIEWTDSMLVTPTVRDTLWKDQTHEKNAISSIEERLIEKPASLTDKDKLVSGKAAANPALNINGPGV